MKTSELTDAALDWAVAKCDEFEGNTDDDLICYVLGSYGWKYSPSTNWAQGGPIIEQERMTIEFIRWDDVDAALPVWSATRIEGHSVCEAEGFSPLVAAMRCYVASKMGDEIDVPAELSV